MLEHEAFVAVLQEMSKGFGTSNQMSPAQVQVTMPHLPHTSNKIKWQLSQVKS
jgi:hypothetical protein